jgi:hypothetical protein
MIFIILSISCISISNALSYSNKSYFEESNEDTSNGYGIQWKMDYGRNPLTGARYQGPQPIGDCDNDGKNELLISGRDSAIRVMVWDENKQTYSQNHILRPPLYPLIRCDAGGMAIGDITNDGENEIAATWYTTIHKYVNSRYRIIGFNPYIFFKRGGSADCLIGDCDNDGKNELILSGGQYRRNSPVAEITVFEWNDFYLKRVAEWNDPDENGYVYMSGLGDVDYDGENEIVCAYENKVMVLNWNSENSEFIPTRIFVEIGNDSPFGVVCKDCDNDGKAEILLSYYNPRITIFKWNGTSYDIQFDRKWPNGKPVIEGIDVGDTDDDGLNEVAVGTGETYILQWNGTTYVEEAVLPTFGWMAVVCIGDCDNDGKNEINTGNVFIDFGQQYTEWVFKHGWQT